MAHTKLVADASVFYQKLRHCHWHVRGERFFELHEKRDEQDKNLWMLRAWLGE